MKNYGNVEEFVRDLNSLCESYGLFLSVGGNPLYIFDVDGMEPRGPLYENQIETTPIYVLEDQDDIG